MNDLTMMQAIAAAGSAIGAGIAVISGIGAGIGQGFAAGKSCRSCWKSTRSKRRYNVNYVTWCCCSRIYRYLRFSYIYNPYIR